MSNNHINVEVVNPVIEKKKSFKYTFICLAITFILGFICEQFSGYRQVSIPLGILSILFGFPIPFIFLVNVLKNNEIKNIKDFAYRIIIAALLYIFSIISATILLFNAINNNEPIRGLVVVTSSLLGYSSLILYIDTQLK
tara:strand:- start:329 stop:748 length:420 start_codon:yes stop_codon:yes gene_type:complete